MPKFKVQQKDDGYAVYRYNALSGNYQLHFPPNDRVLSEEEANEYCESCNNLAQEENEIPADENHFKPDGAKIKPNSEDTKWGTGWIIFIIFTIMLAIFTVVGFIKSCDGPSSNPSQYSKESQYKNFGDAINDGSIDYGMTYNQIKKVCGPANDVIETDGVVSHVRYGSAGDVYQVDFRGGRMWTYSKHRW